MDEKTTNNNNEQDLQQEEKVISDVNEELTEHVEKVEQATEAEQ